MGMTRAWGSEEMEEEEKEKSEKMKSSFRDLVYEWVGSDLIWDTVNDWIEDYNSHAGKSTFGNFVNYCFRFTENADDHYELHLWLLNLVAHFMAKEENWLDNADDSKHWGELFLCEGTGKSHLPFGPSPGKRRVRNTVLGWRRRRPRSGRRRGIMRMPRRVWMLPPPLLWIEIGERTCPPLLLQ